MFIIKYRKVWFALSAILIAASIWSIFAYGFKLSIDFKGGTLTELSFEQRLYQTEIESKLSKLDLGSYSIRPSGEKNYVIRTRELNQAEKKLLTESVGGVTERQNTVGPTVGAELQSKALKAIVVVVMMIVLFITFAFRGVSKPVSSWKYGLATIIALAHDVIIPAGIFVYLGHEIDLLFVTGLLAILGYSVHDTIVVFDRVRENLSTGNSNRSEEHT